MALTPGANLNQTGSLTVPRFCRLAIVGHTTEANATLRPMINVLDWYVQTPLPGGDLTTFITNFMSVFQTDYLACLADSYTLDQVTAKYLDNPLNIPIVSAIAQPGTVATDRAASFTAGVVRKLTTVPSRNFRGSMHVGALPESFTTTDHLNTTGTTAYNTMAGVLNGLVTTGVSDGAQALYPILISQTLSNLFASPAVVSWAAVTEFSTNLRIGTMKRRKERSAV